MHAFLNITALAAGVLFFAHAAFGQRVSIGVVGGLGLTEDYRGGGTTTYVWTTQPYVSTVTSTTTTGRHDFLIGPKIELRLPGPFAFEVDALHRNRQWSTTSIFSPAMDFGYGLIGKDVFSVTGSSWEVPLLLKYRLPLFRSRESRWVFLEAGPSLRPFLYSGGAARAGFTAGAGFSMRMKRLNIEPTIRYTRWGADRLTYRPASPNLDQLEFVVGLGGAASRARLSVFGQSLSVGLVGGFGLTGDFPEKGGYASARSKLVGVMVESGLSKNWSVELDGLYRPLTLSESQRATVLTWEFPVLAKYKLSRGGCRPLVEFGPSFRASGNLSGTDPSHAGVTAGAGVETKYHRVAIAPVFRFTRWMADPVGDQFSPHTYTLHNQAEVLVGFSF